MNQHGNPMPAYSMPAMSPFGEPSNTAGGPPVAPSTLHTDSMRDRVVTVMVDADGRITDLTSRPRPKLLAPRGRAGSDAIEEWIAGAPSGWSVIDPVATDQLTANAPVPDSESDLTPWGGFEANATDRVLALLGEFEGYRAVAAAHTAEALANRELLRELQAYLLRGRTTERKRELAKKVDNFLRSAK